MTPPGNRYDRLNEVEGDAAPLFGEEAWIQLPDGSWVRSTDKAAKKLKGKAKGKTQPPPEPDFVPTRPSKPEAKPVPKPEVKAEPEPAEKPAEKKGMFSRKSSADRQRQAELEYQAELEREAQRSRRVDEERERQAELERERNAELERKAAQERARAAELEREIELERARVARLEEEVERERQRQADLEYERERERERERQRQTDLDLKTSTGVFGRWPDEQPVYPEPERWPEVSKDYRTDYREPEPQYPEPSRWPNVDSWPESSPANESRPEPKPVRRQEPRRRKTAHRQLGTGQRVAAVAAAIGMTVVAVAIGAGIRWLGPDPAAALRPFTEAGAPGESVDVRTFTITVQTARAATSLQAGPAAQATQGVWVIVRVRLSANHEPTPIGYAAVRDRAGRTYLASDRVRQPLIDGSRAFQPGIPIEGEVIFEVPKDALDGLTVLFAAHPDRLAMNTVAAVELPAMQIGPAEQPPATLAPTEVKP